LHPVEYRVWHRAVDPCFQCVELKQRFTHQLIRIIVTLPF
jgi:hypothetical protein